MTLDSLKAKQELPEVKKKPTNPNRLNMTRDQAMEENRKAKELQARLAIESERIQKELEEEGERETKKKKIKKVKVSDLNEEDTKDNQEEI